MKVPELEARIIAHGKALLEGAAASEAFVDPAARENYRAAVIEATRHRFDSCERLALARIGEQFMSKIRLWAGDKSITLLIRWKRASDGAWVIADAEDTTGKRSPWSDIAHYSQERGGVRDA